MRARLRLVTVALAGAVAAVPFVQGFAAPGVAAQRQAGVPAASKSGTQYYVIYNDTNGDLYATGFVKWKGRKFCQQEWYSSDIGRTRHYGFIASPKGSKYAAKSFDDGHNRFTVWLNRSPNGYTESYDFGDGYTLDGFMLWTGAEAKAEFLSESGGKSAASYKCPF